MKVFQILKRFRQKLNNLNERREWVEKKLKEIPRGKKILDAGCGEQQFKLFTEHLVYKSQDFGKYTLPEKKAYGAAETELYNYGELDYVGDIWNIKEADETFDAIMCTEVLEHIPYPNETLKEFSRLLKPGGILILTAPSNCLRHMDPYFFYSGFSDRYYETILNSNKLRIKELTAVGDYFSWLAVEMYRTMKQFPFSAPIFLLPAFVYFFFIAKKDKNSIESLCMGYHVLAIKE